MAPAGGCVREVDTMALDQVVSPLQQQVVVKEKSKQGDSCK